MTDIPYLAPGCFGSALIFKGDDMVCTACVMRSQCEPVHMLALEQLRASLGITAPVAKPKVKIAATQAERDDPTRMALPKKVRELLEAIDRARYNIKGNMLNGVNPFAGQPKMRFMLVACHLILSLSEKRPITQRDFVTGFISKLHHSPQTAEAHARMAVQVLMHVGAIDNVDGVLKLRRS